MNVITYAPLARVTLKELPFRPHMIHMSLGVLGELGELIDAAKKHYIYGKARDTVNESEEWGDGMWYIANLLPELSVAPELLNNALSEGYENGARARELAEKDMNMGQFLVDMMMAASRIVSPLCPSDAPIKPHTVQAAAAVEGLGMVFGTIAGIMGIDMLQSLDRNIEKLKVRYGDKFSAHAALNRDLGAERSVLEGDNVQH